MSDRGAWAHRRAAFFDAMIASAGGAGGGPSVAVLPSAPVFIRNNDVEHEYRQDSDFFYLTGFDEPESVAVLDAQSRTLTLFVRPRDREREIWDGPRAGIEGARETYGADASYVISELDDRLPALLQDRRRVHYRIGYNRRFDDRLLAAIDRVRARQRTGVFPPSEIVDTGAILHEMRLRKGPEELAAMRAAARVTRAAHERAMRQARPGMREFEVEAMILDTFRGRGSER